MTGTRARLLACSALTAAAMAVCGGRAAGAASWDDGLDIYSVNEFGGVGLLQTRTARFAPDGMMEVGASFLNPFRRYYINWQILPWLETNFRYTDITNRPTGGTLFDQSQSRFFSDLFGFRSGGTYLDRGLDFKIRLWEESSGRPALAMGIQDALGTGVFGGEYIVASKRFSRLDVHLGMGWGFLGSRGFLPNPMRIFGGRYDERDADIGKGGKVSFGNFFAGHRAALFGGFEYHLPIDGLSVKLEYNGNDPETNFRSSPMEEDFPVGVGINYRIASWFDLSLGFERGNSIMFRTALRSNLLSRGIPKTDPPQPEIAVRPPQGELDAVRERVDLSRAGKADMDALYGELEALEIDVLSLRINVVEATLRAGDSEAGSGWKVSAARVLFRYLPGTVNKVTLHPVEEGPAIGAVVYSRSSIEFLADLENEGALGPEGMALRGIRLHRRDMELDIDPAASGHSARPVPAGAVPVHALADVRRLKYIRGHDTMGMVDLMAARVEEQAGVLFDGVEEGGLEASEIRMSAKSLAVFTPDGAVSETADAGRAAPMLKRAAREFGLTRAALVSESGLEQQPRSTGELAEDIFRDLKAAGFTGYALDVVGAEASLYLSKTRYLQIPRNLGWASRIAANHLPPEVEWITVVQMDRGAEVSRVKVLRSDLERQQGGHSSPAEVWHNARLLTPGGGLSDGAEINPEAYPNFGWSLGPSVSQHIGDPSSGIYLADLYAALSGHVSLAPGLTISATARRFIVGNLDNITRESDSVLPHVRSDIVRYLREGRTALVQLQVDYIASLAPGLTARASAGIFESMFGGVGGEILYRPFEARWAVGADLNWVRQRGYDQLLDFRDYDVLTGHASLYYDWPYYDIRTVVSAGRYLAGDYGVTIDASRRFESGVRVGAFATFTDVSAAEFGEGSFDKGFYIKVPLEALLPRSTRQTSTFLFRPLSRDGGQRLEIGQRLFDIAEDANYFGHQRDWSRIFE